MPIGALATAAVPAIISAGANIFGGSQANAANAKEASKNRAFQERMRGTQYQTAVEDLRKAGLNPALAYQQGGAGTPSGATPAPMQNVAGTAADRAVQTAATVAQTAKTKAEANQISIESASRLAAIDATINNLYSMAANTDARTATDRATRQGHVNVLDAQTNNIGAHTAALRREGEFFARSFEERLQGIRLENGLMSAHARESDVRTRLGSQGLQHDWFRKNVSPWINDAGAFGNLIGQFTGIRNQIASGRAMREGASIAREHAQIAGRNAATNAQNAATNLRRAEDAAKHSQEMRNLARMQRTRKMTKNGKEIFTETSGY